MEKNQGEKSKNHEQHPIFLDKHAYLQGRKGDRLLFDGHCTKYIFVGDKRVALKRSTGEINFYSTDHLGSTTVVTDAVGAKAEEIRYYPYGLTLSDTGTVSLSHKYAF